MKEINDILNYKSYEDFNSLDLRELDLKTYKIILNLELKDLSESQSQITNSILIKNLILAVNQQIISKEQKIELESIYYDLLLTWVSTYQLETLSSIMAGKEIVSILTKVITNEKLNAYDEENQNSILKQLLIRYENNSLFEIFHENGLKFIAVEGLNPYYYTLLKGTSTNMTVQLLYKLNVTLPKGYWSYLFNAILNEKIDKERNFLLSLPQKEFIVNKNTQDNVWSAMIKSEKYDLLLTIPKEFYKPAKVKNKSIFDLMVEKNNFTLVKKLGIDFIKLLESNEDILNVLSYMVKNKESRATFISNFLYQLIHCPQNESQKTSSVFIDLKKEWDNAQIYLELNQKTIINKLILSSYNFGEKNSLEEEAIKKELLEIDNVINTYKNRKELSENMRKQILSYLNFIGKFDINLNKQSQDFYLKYYSFSNGLKQLNSQFTNDTTIDEKVFESIFFNLDLVVFEAVCEEAITYLKSYKVPDMSKVYEKISDFADKKLTIFSKEEIDENLVKEDIGNKIFNNLISQKNENLNVFLNESEIRNNIIKIEKLVDSNEKEAIEIAESVINDMKVISQYPKIMPSNMEPEIFMQILKDIEIPEVLSLLQEIDKELQTPKVDKISEKIDKEILDNKEEILDNKSEETIIQLFKEESFSKFKKEFAESNNEVLSGFIKKHKYYQLYQTKILAKASEFLKNIDVLYKTFPHFEKVIQHIENFMVLQDKGDKSFYIPPLLLGGGPGVGKTFFCNTISKLVNTPFELLNMESMTANFILTGSNSQWRDATPGKIFRSLFDLEKPNMNPIFLLDELEKAGGDSRYGVMNSLLPLLERYTAKQFKDECIPLEIDASYIVWFATANDLDKLTAPIKSRFDIFSVPNPNPTQRKSLIKGIYKTVRENNTWGQYFEENLPEESLDVLANLMAPGAARDLRKSLTMACSKAIREESKLILPKHIERYENGETMPWDIVVST